MNKTILLFFILWIGLVNYAHGNDCEKKTGKKIKIHKHLKLSKKVDETSGIIIYQGAFLTHNDSGGKPILYRIDTLTGKVVGKIEITNAKNRDWEDITQDEEYIYVGDFGNNSGKRKNLRIYKIAKKNIIDNYCQVKAELIQFHYSEQLNFEKRPYQHDFDCEAMTSYGDSLLLFTKNWANHKTRMYSISKTPGNYEITARQTTDVQGLITAASYNPSLHTLILLGYINYRPFLIINKDFTGKLDKNLKRLKIKKRRYTQTEGVFLNNDGTLYISSEKTKAFPQKIYKLSLYNIEKK